MSSVSPVRGFRSDVTLDQQSVTMTIRLELTENLTALPLVNVTLQNPANIMETMGNAIRRQVSSATLQTLQLQVRTVLLKPTSQSITAQSWLLQENYTMRIVGSSSSTGEMVSTNVAFLSMNMSDPIMAPSQNGTLVELNQIGGTYLLQPLKTIPRNPTTAYFFNGAQFSNTQIPGINTEKFRLMDLTWVPPISSWNQTANLLGQTTRWDLNNQTASSLFQQGAPFNLTIGLAKRETTYTPIYQAILDPSLELRVQATSWAAGTTVYFDLPTWIDTVMAVIVIVTFASAIVTALVDRRLSRRAPTTKRRKDKTNKT